MSDDVVTVKWPNPPSFFTDFVDSSVLDSSVPPPFPFTFPVPIRISSQSPSSSSSSSSSFVYPVFGQPYCLLPSFPPLSYLDVHQVFPSSFDFNRRLEMKKILRSIMVLFIEVLQTLVEDPASSFEGFRKLETLFLNLLHVANFYRLDQARDSLVRLIRMRTERKMNSLQRLRILVKEEQE